MIPIYPEVLICSTEDPDSAGRTIINIATKLRKKHTDGKWYLQHISHKASMSDTNFELRKGIFITDFHQHVYNLLIIGEMVPNFTMPDGKPYSELDTNQEEETVRLSKIIGRVF